MRLGRLEVFRIRTIVPDERKGHRHDLATVGRVGEDLLVAGHRRVEDDLAGACARRAEGLAGEHAAVLERESADHAVASSVW